MRRTTSAAAVAVAVAVTLAGCGLGSKSSSSDSTKTVNTTAALSGSITFQTWSLKNDKFTPYFTKLVSDFEAAHPGTTINWIDQPGDGYAAKVTSQAASGALPDVVNLPQDFAYPLAKTGDLLDLKKNVPNLTTDWVAAIVNAYSYPDVQGGGTAYGFPWYTGTDVNYWNKAMFAKDGLDITKLPTNLDELIAAAKTMHDNSAGKDYLMSRAPGLGDFVNAGVSLMSADGTKFAFNTPAAAAVLDKYAAAYKAGYMPTNVFSGDYEGNDKLFKKQEVAWTTAGGRYISQLSTDVPTLAPNVVPSQAFVAAPLYTQALSVSAKSKNLALALAFAEFVTDNDNQAAFIKLAPGFLPGSAAAAKDPQYSKSDGTPQGDASVDAFQALLTAKNMQPPKWSDAMNTFLGQQVEQAVTGKKSSQAALDAAVSNANNLLTQ